MPRCDISLSSSSSSSFSSSPVVDNLSAKRVKLEHAQDVTQAAASTGTSAENDEMNFIREDEGGEEGEDTIDEEEDRFPMDAARNGVQTSSKAVRRTSRGQETELMDETPPKAVRESARKKAPRRSLIDISEDTPQRGPGKQVKVFDKLIDVLDHRGDINDR
eukprot:gene44013-54694_t